jgi:hypothetical protein
MADDHHRDKFDGVQSHYPVPRKRDYYVRRDLLTKEQREWNVARMRAAGLHRHADALEAEGHG